MKTLILISIGIAALCYPLIVFVGINHVSPALFGLGLLVVTAIKLTLTKNQLDSKAMMTSGLLILYSALVAFSNNALLLKFYPVVISLAMALLFFRTLFEEQSMIERFARAAKKNITQNAKKYTKKLTALWVIVLTANASIAAYLALYGSLALWTLYNGLISYTIFALLFAIEYVYRQYYIRKYGE